MDPAANVREQWEILSEERPNLARLFELRNELTAWRRGGGFAPALDPPTWQDIEAVRPGARA